jgi:hypothetical protein
MNRAPIAPRLTDLPSVGPTIFGAVCVSLVVLILIPFVKQSVY